MLPFSDAAAQTNWTGANSDAWLDPGNWDAGVPDNTDNTTISAVGGFANDALISMDGMETNVLYIGNQVGESGDLTITGGGLTSSYVFLGDGGDGHLIVTTSSSLVVNAETYIGYNSGAGGGVGILDILDGSSLTAASHLNIGANSTGTLNISNSTASIGGTFTVGSGNSGADGTMSITNAGSLSSGTTWITEGFGSQATIRVNGAGSEWNSSGTIYMGASSNFIADGDSTIIVENGGVVSSVNTYVGIRGFSASHLVTITDAGSEWVTSSNLYVGFGTGFIDNQVHVLNGGTLTTDWGFIGYSEFGYSSGYGELLIDGAGSEWNSGSAWIGYNGGGASAHGEVTISNGGALNAVADISVGGGAFGGIGYLTVTGTGSEINAQNLQVGGGWYGEALLEDGAVANIGGGGVFITGSYGAGITSSLTVTGAGSAINNTGVLYIGQDFYQGILEVEDGASMQATGSYIGMGMNALGTFNLSGIGSTFTDASVTYIGGSAGTGSMTISDGAAASSLVATIGYDYTFTGAGGTGQVDIMDTGSTWTITTDLVIGDMGSSGTLTITDGGVVSSVRGIVGTDSSFFLGIGGFGNVTVDGAGSEWTMSGDTLIGDTAGFGTLTISDGGTVNTGGNAIVGGDSIALGFAGNGTVTVTNAGSLWAVTGDLVIGDAGSTGALTISNGGEVTSDTAKIGRGLGSTGSALVTGAGSLWTVTTDFYVGTLLDDADFTVEAGAVVNAGGDAYVGDGGTATALVTDANSEWNIAGDLFVGTNDGDGELTISATGLVSADTLILGGIGAASVGTLNIGSAPADAAVAPGVLDAPTVAGGAGTGEINFKHTSASYDFDAAVSGNIAVFQRAGTTILTAVNTYTGATSVLGGRLIVDGSVTSDTTVSASATLGGTGTVNNVINNGIIAPGALTTPGTFTIEGNYLGNAGSELRLNTELGLDASPTDLLVFNSGAATGATEVFITNAGGTGGYSTTDGIRIIQAVNGATIQAAMFTLGAPVQVGIYDYDLVQGGDDISEQYDFFLHAANLSSNVPVYAATPELVMGYMRETLGTVHDRMDLGEEVKAQQRLGFNDDSSSLADIAAMEGAWVRIFGGQRTFESGDAVNSGYKADFGGAQAGKDIYRAEHNNGSADHVGLYIAQGKAKADMTSVNGNGGKASFDSTTGGAYWTHFTAKNAYASVNAQYSRVHEFKITPTGGNGINPAGDSYAAAVEVGKKIKSVKGLIIEPQAQAIYQYLKLADDNDGINNISFNPQSSVTGRIGLRLSRAFETNSGLAIQPWGRFNVLHTVEKNSRITMGTDTFDTPFGGTQGEIQAGISIGRPFKSGDAGWSLYLNAGYLASISQSPSTEGWTTSAGIKWMW